MQNTDSTEIVGNPFVLMLNPAEVFQAMERSERLERLQRRVCRPLDKPLIPRVESDINAYDHLIDLEPEADNED